MTTVEEVAANVAILRGDVDLQIAARVYRTDAQTIATSTEASVAFTHQRRVDGGLHTTADDTKMTVYVPGWYLVGASVAWTANATGRRSTYLRLNGATDIGRSLKSTSHATLTEKTAVTTVYHFAAADYVEVRVFQDSGGNLDLAVAANQSPEFWMARL